MPTDSREIQRIRRGARLCLILLALSGVVAVPFWAGIGWGGYAVVKWLVSLIRDSGVSLTIAGVVCTALVGASIIWLTDLGDGPPYR
jgi:hypothetical protein